jgi:hypothetical protein
MSGSDERVEAWNGEVRRSHEDDAHRVAYGESRWNCLPRPAEWQVRKSRHYRKRSRGFPDWGRGRRVVPCFT